MPSSAAVLFTLSAFNARSLFKHKIGLSNQPKCADAVPPRLRRNSAACQVASRQRARAVSDFAACRDNSLGRQTLTQLPFVSHAFRPVKICGYNGGPVRLARLNGQRSRRSAGQVGQAAVNMQSKLDNRLLEAPINAYMAC